MPNKNKLPKLRELKCVICGKIFFKHISPSAILKGVGKTCSKKCFRILISNIQKKGEYRKCKRCGKEFWSTPCEDRRGIVRKYCSRYCWRPIERGKAISYDGYYVINGKKVHRLVMENYLNRKLLSTEIVHHINFNRLDNKIENLKIVSRREHNKIHKFISKNTVL